MSHRPRRLAVVAAVAATVLACVAPAVAAQDPVIADCTANQQLTATYTVQQLQHALQTMSPTVKEYSNCYDVITRALGQLGGHNNGSSNSSGGSFLPVWLIIVLVVLIVGAGAYAVLAYRNRGAGSGPGGEQ